MINKDAVMEALSTVEDPELKKPLTDLGMIKNVIVDDGLVSVGVTLTVPGCPMKDKIKSDITAAVTQLEGVNEVRVEYDVMTDEQRAELRRKLGHGAPSQQPEPLTFAKRYICIASGKGGVGKSTVTTNLATALVKMGKRVGLLDADVYGFSIPRMIGVNAQPTVIDNKIVPLRKGEKLQILSIGFFIDENEPVIWRGPLLHKTITQFLTDTLWDELDYLLIDLPPGTGDTTITIAQAIPSAELVVVTTPQSTATNVAVRVAGMADKTKLKVIGVIENMAFYEHGEQRDYIFGKDGGKKLAEKLRVPLLGVIPIDITIREGSDKGTPVASGGSEKLVSMFQTIANNMIKTAG